MSTACFLFEKTAEERNKRIEAMTEEEMSEWNWFLDGTATLFGWRFIGAGKRCAMDPARGF